MTAKKAAKAEGTNESSGPAADETTAETGAPLDGSIESVASRPLGLHERLEEIELSMMTLPQEQAGALNRVTLLTGALKTLLPKAIEHVADDAARHGMETLLGLL